MHPHLKVLAARISETLLTDQPALRRRLDGVGRRLQQGKPADQSLAALEKEIEQSCARRLRRAQSLPVPLYPDALPVCEHREEIKAAIAAHQVVIVAGETGSGKTTQLPKICLDLGRGVAGMIGHTQPRRIAARSLATRIASELRSEMGHKVGYKVRFSDRISPDTYIKVMTDGILLAETQSDPQLLAYDTLLIDEAHERSLNIDFLLGYLRQLLPRRPDLKLIITSATIDVTRFSRHFNDAPVFEVPGRTYPVEVRYRPPAGEDDESREGRLVPSILEAVDEIGALDRSGHILIFLPGEREIRATAEALRKHHPPGTEILSLYARLNAAEQNRVFEPTPRRRIVLATNVAETSLTVPGVRYVIDPGLARISRYSARSKVQRLPIERISQASARQRAGRCGRLGPGVCIRLYAEEDFHGRPEYTEPEIRRTNLASIILQMKALGLGDIEQFPFVDAPEGRQISDGFKLLQELGALDERRELTILGAQLARLPVDPRIGRMVLAARVENCLSEMLVIAAALSVQDPRDRPADHQQAADERHRPFQDERSDYLSYLNLREWFQEQKKHLSHNKLRQACRDNFLSYVRLQEWSEVEQQLAALVKDMGMRANQTPADYAQVHRALLTGLLGNLGIKEEKSEYLGARGHKFHIFPGSALHKRSPRWVMAAEIIETSRLYARTVAEISPQWVEQVAAHLCKRSYAEPHWEKKRGQVVAYETLTLYGLPVVTRRAVDFGAIDPTAAREIMIREALVPGELITRAAFLAENRRLIGEIQELEHKSRRHDVLVDEEALFRFYDQCLPPDIVNVRRLENWYRQTVNGDPNCLRLTREYLMRHEAGNVTEGQFPDQLVANGVALALSYRFEPGNEEDGVTVTLPLGMINQVSPARFDWLVPGLLRDKVIFMIRALPKAMRRNFVPAPDFADAALESLAPGDEPLCNALSRVLSRISGVSLASDAWSGVEYPAHLLMNFRVVGVTKESCAMGRDLGLLQGKVGGQATASFSDNSARQWGRDRVVCWDFGELPSEVDLIQNGVKIRGYPTLVDEKEWVRLCLLDTPEKARSATRNGLRRLFMLQLPDKLKYLRRNLPGLQKMCLRYTKLGTCDELRESLVELVCDRAFALDEGTVRSDEEFRVRLERGGERLLGLASEVCTLVDRIMAEHHTVLKLLGQPVPAPYLNAVADMRAQLERLFTKGFLLNTPFEWLIHFPRYLQAMQLRLQKLPHALERDRRHILELERLYRLQESMAAKKRVPAIPPEKMQKWFWLMEELRVSLFAQELKTAVPVSVKRLETYFESP